ncbi:AAA family ATPase [Roseobacter sp. HKCCD9010]|uniref:ATP-binding protein n=1 Tax=unclassified Roseobacter TaxID=196798 RepID=UPI00149097AA|nr:MULTISPECIES: ATP-binding protein [unclassified Roseobacter]MBF9052479.1 AAA family ATPase [Rhodobacterales bacterium HKCCD4356]NNV14176.1 AAA family ATPase [Roseobacter sp. HKCCD7357]NNV18671.1 AAA family ATPase [Roseobacter sp. HKCCD8768]NNV28123.1 AAA family ATPase [Roseobacter sp. HKCCD8192]NNV32405.1 AAA family ATPase [Roseobacter sp. HKCCD9061]
MNEVDEYLPRHLTPELQEALATARVVNVVGPRQVGKTTLVRDLFEQGRFVTLDDAAILAAMEADPEGQLTSLAEEQSDVPVIIDEAQRCPKLALTIKKIVDHNRRKGQFVLTGSSNVFTTAEVADSLAGRMQTLKLWPLTTSEVNRLPANRLIDWAMQGTPSLPQISAPTPLGRKDYVDFILMGGYPEIRTLPLRSRQRRYRDYIDAVVDRDVADVMPVRKPDALRFLIDQMAVRTAQEINTSELAKLAKLKRETVDQYLDILMRLSMVTKLSAWMPGESKRDIKQPKFHFVDTGVASALRRLNDRSFDIGNSPEALGGLMESFVVGELQRALPMQDEDYRLYHWRSADRREIDILIDGGHRLAAIEVKSAATVAADDFKHLKWFANDGPGKGRSTVGIVFYLGQEKLTIGDGNFALPLSTLWAAVDLS